MPHIFPDPLNRAIERLVSEIGKFTDDENTHLKPDHLERFARAISVHLKALHDLEEYNRSEAQNDEDKRYLSYEDLPPPSPQERAVLIARIRCLYNQVNVECEVPSSS